jgi:hypothetical protein
VYTRGSEQIALNRTFTFVRSTDFGGTWSGTFRISGVNEITLDYSNQESETFKYTNDSITSLATNFTYKITESEISPPQGISGVALIDLTNKCFRLPTNSSIQYLFDDYEKGIFRTGANSLTPFTYRALTSTTIGITLFGSTFERIFTVTPTSIVTSIGTYELCPQVSGQSQPSGPVYSGPITLINRYYKNDTTNEQFHFINNSEVFLNWKVNDETRISLFKYEIKRNNIVKIGPMDYVYNENTITSKRIGIVYTLFTPSGPSGSSGPSGLQSYIIGKIYTSSGSDGGSGFIEFINDNTLRIGDQSGRSSLLEYRFKTNEIVEYYNTFFREWIQYIITDNGNQLNNLNVYTPFIYKIAKTCEKTTFQPTNESIFTSGSSRIRIVKTLSSQFIEIMNSSGRTVNFQLSYSGNKLFLNGVETLKYSIINGRQSFTVIARPTEFLSPIGSVYAGPFDTSCP